MTIRIKSLAFLLTIFIAFQTAAIADTPTPALHVLQINPNTRLMPRKLPSFNSNGTATISPLPYEKRLALVRTTFGKKGTLSQTSVTLTPGQIVFNPFGYNSGNLCDLSIYASGSNCEVQISDGTAVLTSNGKQDASTGADIGFSMNNAPPGQVFLIDIALKSGYPVPSNLLATIGQGGSTAVPLTPIVDSSYNTHELAFFQWPSNTSGTDIFVQAPTTWAISSVTITPTQVIP